MANERDEIQAKNQELDEEIDEYDRQIGGEDMKLGELTEQARLIAEEIDAKEQELI